MEALTPLQVRLSGTFWKVVSKHPGLRLLELRGGPYYNPQSRVHGTVAGMEST